MQLKTDQERVSSLLKETITLMCKNGLKFDSKFCIDAVIGVTLDEKEVFLISLNEVFKSEKAIMSDSGSSDGEASNGIPRKKRKRNKAIKAEQNSSGDSGSEDDDDRTSLPRKPPSQKRIVSKPSSTEQDSNDDNAIMFIKEEPNSTWQEQDQSAGPYQHQNTTRQSTQPQIDFSAFANTSIDSSNLSPSEVSFTSSRNQVSMMGHQSQVLSPYSNTTGQLASAQAHNMAQGQDQISQFRISSASVSLRKDEDGVDVSHIPDDSDDLSQFMASLPASPKTPKTKVNRHCEICDKGFTSQYGYMVHLKRHSGIHPYTCEVCGKGMSSKTNYDEHMRHHTGELLNCDNCSRTFITHRAYKTHMLSCK